MVLLDMTSASSSPPGGLSLLVSERCHSFHHHDGAVFSMTSPSHKIQDGCQLRDFGDRISSSGFRRQDSVVSISETGFRRQDFGDRILGPALLIDQNEFSDFSVTDRLPTWCHNFENFELQITACYKANICKNFWTKKNLSPSSFQKSKNYLPMKSRWEGIAS